MNEEVDQTANLRNDLQEWSKKMKSGYAELGEFIVEFSQLEFLIERANKNALPFGLSID